uniref:Uncharacterized protein n=1 Tax=Globisporangium ultimum (strain ATCC 200006 / CBS 805.95 / DAOM BR144) TaxID=431595 RepID=K3X9R0_GLOUD
MTPPAVSSPIDNGATSKSSRSCKRLDLSDPLKIAACTVAPNATASSGLIDLYRSLPLKKSDSNCCTFGMRVEPPTSTTSCTWLFESFASRNTRSTGSMILEPRTRDRAVEVNALEQRVDFNVRLGRRRQRTLGTLARCAQATQRALVPRHVLAVLALELLHEVLDYAIVKVFAAQVGIAGRGLDFEDAFFDREQRHIERAAAKVKDQDIVLAALLVQPVRDRGRSRFINDAQHVQARNDASVFGRLAL